MSKQILFSLICLGTGFGCAQAPTPWRAPAAIEANDFFEREDFRLLRKSQAYSGHFQGIRIAGKEQHFKLTECSFSYDKGSDHLAEEQRDYRYERFMVSFMGVNARGEKAFDSVTYSQSDYTDSFKSFDYSGSFGPLPLPSANKVQDGPAPQMIFSRLDDKRAMISLRHSDAYSAKNSSFYEPGERREYEVELTFSEFSPTKINLEHVKVVAYARRMAGGQIGSRHQVVDVDCSNFGPEAE
jgi:hypothetical protein